MITYEFNEEIKTVTLYDDTRYCGALFGITTVKVQGRQVWFLTGHPDTRVTLHDVEEKAK